MSQTLKSRISVIILMALLLSLMSTMCFATEATVTEQTEEEITAEPVKAKLNTKIYFEGKTYTFSNGKRVRKSYEDGELGCGVISLIVPNKEYGVYVSGEGWISEQQIIDEEQYITLTFNKIENGLNSNLKVNGEFISAESDNDGIITFNDGMLEARANGTTTVNFTTKDGKEIEVLATVYDGEVELNIPEKSVTIEGNISADLVDKKVNISADGEATAALKIENGSIGVEADGNGNVKATVEDKEILDASISAEGSATANENGISASGSSSQTMTLLQRLTLKLNERVNANIDKEKASAGAGGDVSVNDKEMISGDAEMKYEYGAEDPTADVNVDVLDKNVVNVEEKTVPVLSALRALLAKIK